VCRFCGVSVSRVCVVCCSSHHRVMSQARDDFEGFLKAHMTEEEKVIVQLKISLAHKHMHTLTDSITQSLAHSLSHSLTHSPFCLSVMTQLSHSIPAEKSFVYSSPPSIFVTILTHSHSLIHSLAHCVH